LLFKKERAVFFHKQYNSCHKSLEEVEAIFRQVDLMCNSINEKTGKNIDAEEMYLMVLYQLNGSLNNLDDINLNELYNEIEQIIFKYSPTVFNPQTHECLNRIYQTPDITMSLLSNTAFIKGCTLRKILDQLDLAKYFDFQIYSDEEGYSKPNRQIFQRFSEEVNLIRKDSAIGLHEIMHVGDNYMADILGAQAFGIQAFQINTNEKLINHLFD
jgi:putative hydrolase of the HAD superfamily